MTRWLDISQPFTSTTTTWNGDVPFSYTCSADQATTGSVNIGQMTTSLHTGTHIDAPYHFDAAGATIEQLDINAFIGIAQVIHVIGVDSVTPDHLSIDERATHILLRTTERAVTTHFPSSFTTIHPSIGPHLATYGIRLLGVDTPTIDPADSKTLDAHHALHRASVHILENIVLDHIEEGLYESIALPLAIDGGDGSPTRAVIRPLE